MIERRPKPYQYPGAVARAGKVTGSGCGRQGCWCAHGGFCSRKFYTPGFNEVHQRLVHTPPAHSTPVGAGRLSLGIPTRSPLPDPRGGSSSRSLVEISARPSNLRGLPSRRPSSGLLSPRRPTSAPRPSTRALPFTPPAKPPPTPPPCFPASRTRTASRNKLSLVLATRGRSDGRRVPSKASPDSSPHRAHPRRNLFRRRTPSPDRVASHRYTY